MSVVSVSNNNTDTYINIWNIQNIKYNMSVISVSNNNTDTCHTPNTTTNNLSVRS